MNNTNKRVDNHKQVECYQMKQKKFAGLIKE